MLPPIHMVLLVVCLHLPERGWFFQFLFLHDLICIDPGFWTFSYIHGMYNVCTSVILMHYEDCGVNILYNILKCKKTPKDMV